MPAILPTSAGAVLSRDAAWEELPTALDIILAAAANLRHYRERLSPEEHTATVRDIEQAAEQIARGLAAEPSSPHGAMTGGKRRKR